MKTYLRKQGLYFLLMETEKEIVKIINKLDEEQIKDVLNLPQELLEVLPNTFFGSFFKQRIVVWVNNN